MKAPLSESEFMELLPTKVTIPASKGQTVDINVQERMFVEITTETDGSVMYKADLKENAENIPERAFIAAFKAILGYLDANYTNVSFFVKRPGKEFLFTIKPIN